MNLALLLRLVLFYRLYGNKVVIFQISIHQQICIININSINKPQISNIIYHQRKKYFNHQFHFLTLIKQPIHMQPVLQQTQPKQSLRQDDISNIIKHFSFTIQQRFEQIQKNCNYFTCLNSINYERTDLEKDIIHRYNEYKTSNEHQIKLLEKFVDRLMQIFEFFRQKTQEPQILHAMGEKISEKLRQILKNQSNCHFFVNNRPKTHSTNVKPFGNRSASNDFLSIVGPVCKQQLDLTAVFINNGKKVRTQTTQEKRTVQVGKLFKYVFSVLKRGFLIKLRMEKPQKKTKPQGPKELSCIEEANTISVEGTCAIMRNCSQKGQKQGGSQPQATRMIISSKDKAHMVSGFHNKKQFYIYQKSKNRSVSTNQYSFLSKQNHSILKQSAPKLRQLDKKVNLLYECMNIQKYSVVRVAKDPEMGKKDQVKRNSWIDHESKKYQSEFNRWVNKCTNTQVQIRSPAYQPEDFVTPHNEEAEQTFTYDRNFYSENCDQIIESSIQQSKIGEIYDTSQFENSADYDANDPIVKNFKTQQVEENNAQSTEKPIESAVHTLIVCSSRNYPRKDSALADKSSNLMDIERNHSRFKEIKTQSVKQEKNDRKALRLNLPSMLGDKSNLLNEPNLRVAANLTNQQKNSRMSQKSQFYLQNYHTDINDDNSFVPLLPKREKNSENVYESRNESVTIKRKNLVPNFHPLNRCRIFREKKTAKNYNVLQGTEVKLSGMDESIAKGKIRNSLY